MKYSSNKPADFQAAMYSEEDRIYEVWSSKVPALFNGMDRVEGTKIAVLMENQRTMNELTKDGVTQFLRMSIPLIYRIYGPSLWIKNIVEFASMLGPNNGVVIAKPRQLRTRFMPVTSVTWRHTNDQIIQETAHAKQLSEDIQKEIVGEVLRDLSNNVACVGFSVSECMSKIKARSGRDAIWAVCNTAYNADALREKNLKVYVTDQVPATQVLLGSSCSAYYYAPYVPLTTIEKDAEWGIYGLMSRYGKKLSDKGTLGRVIVG